MDQQQRMTEDICRVKEEKDTTCSKPSSAATGTGPSDSEISQLSHHSQQDHQQQPQNSSTSIQIPKDQINEQHISQTRMSEHQQNQSETHEYASITRRRSDAGRDDDDAGTHSRCRSRHAEREEPNELTNGFAYSVCQDITNETVGSNDQRIADLPTRIGTDDLQKLTDYAASIEKVKDFGWYWGPISGADAEKLLANEPDGSFIVRDSSDEHYIFSLTFKLDGLVRHVRIEHAQGNFSFGTDKFRSNTIVDFIEKAVHHSRSGQYLFFLHRPPVVGPMRVQLLHPVSRFNQVQSLQHMCRFVILKCVRKDLICKLPLPKSLKKYLHTPNYYCEELQTR